MIYIQESYVNKTQNCRYGDSPVYETRYDTVSELYKGLQKEFGRCTGKVFIDTSDTTSKQVGWVFIRRAKYEDCNKTYLQETWVTVHTQKPTLQYHYA